MKNLSILLNVLALKAILRLAPSFPLLNTNLRHNTLLTIPCMCVKCSEQFLPLLLTANEWIVHLTHYFLARFSKTIGDEAFLYPFQILICKYLETSKIVHCQGSKIGNNKYNVLRSLLRPYWLLLKYFSNFKTDLDVLQHTQLP